MKVEGWNGGEVFVDCEVEIGEGRGNGSSHRQSKNLAEDVGAEEICVVDGEHDDVEDDVEVDRDNTVAATT